MSSSAATCCSAAATLRLRSAATAANFEESPGSVKDGATVAMLDLSLRSRLPWPICSCPYQQRGFDLAGH